MADTNNTEKAGMAGENLAALYFPQDGPTNFWMYAVIAAGTAFIIFVAVALYTVCRHTNKRSQSVVRGTLSRHSAVGHHSVHGGPNGSPVMATRKSLPKLELT